MRQVKLESFAECQLTKRQKGNTRRNIDMREKNHLDVIPKLEKRELLARKRRYYGLSRKKKKPKKLNRHITVKQNSVLY